jgi:hypothetical protein
MSAVKQPIAIAAVSCLLAGCGNSTAPAPTPVVPPPTIETVIPNLVTTAGWGGRITGTGFQPGAVVTIGNTVVKSNVPDSTVVLFTSGAHAAGSVDITITNPNGLTTTLSKGYTYVSPSSVDLNGDWIGSADAQNDYTTDMRFTIRNDALVSVSCNMPVTLTEPVPISRTDDEFTFHTADGFTMSGTIGPPGTSLGQINAPSCGDGVWWANKSGAIRFWPVTGSGSSGQHGVDHLAPRPAVAG